jgi:FMN reductase
MPEDAHHIGDDIAARLDGAVASLFAEGLRMPPTQGFEPIAFSRVRCSV